MPVFTPCWASPTRSSRGNVWFGPVRRADLRDLVEPSGLPSGFFPGSTALMGFQIFVHPSQVCSHRRAAAASLQQPGPRVRCRRSFIRTRLIFVGLQSARARPGVNGERKRARLADRRMSASMDFWACVFPVCGPFPRRRVRSLMSHAFSERLGSFLPWAFPLSGLSGTLMCIARGSNRARSSASAKPARALSRAPHGVGFFAHAAIE
jgi:hypothetical protein